MAERYPCCRTEPRSRLGLDHRVLVGGGKEMPVDHTGDLLILAVDALIRSSRIEGRGRGRGSGSDFNGSEKRGIKLISLNSA